MSNVYYIPIFSYLKLMLTFSFMLSYSGYIAADEPQIEKRCFISNLESTSNTLVLNGAKIKSHYAFEEKI